jgi:hypothetical protein
MMKYFLFKKKTTMLVHSSDVHRALFFNLPCPDALPFPALPWGEKCHINKFSPVLPCPVAQGRAGQDRIAL